MKPGFNKLISIGALVALTGYVLAGPVSFVVVYLVKPQPPWISSSVFVENYRTIQDLPYYFGFLLIGGMLMLIAGHYLNFKEQDDTKTFHLLLAFAWTIVFSCLISFNYICQTTFVHNLALHYKPEYDSAISMFSMSNPLSFCWANEMWGYAFLGIATLLMSGYYQGKNRFIYSLLITNGIISLASAVATIFDVTWVMTLHGFISYFAWNVLMIILMLTIYFHSKNTAQSVRHIY
jgi:hypothetical protein